MVQQMIVGSFFDTCKSFDDKYIRKVYVKKNQGYGYGIIQGLKEARGEYVGWLHSDLQYNPMDLTAFLIILMITKKKIFF